MGKERDAEWYNRVYSTTEKRYEKEPEKLPWYGSWQWLAQHVKFPKVYDLGCGGGHFLRVLNKTKGTKCKSYVGYDFSSVVIDMARNLNKDTKIPHSFLVADILETKYTDIATYVITETLEHINDDLELVSSIPKSSQILISGPNFDSPGHVRSFSTISKFTERYKDYLDFQSEKAFQAAPGCKIWSAVGIKT